MKNIVTLTAIAFALITPAFADGHATSAEELFAMSNNSAAERLVLETSTGDVEAAEIRDALSNMSAAERKVFFEADESTRMEVFTATRKLNAGNSPAETAAKVSN